jgi:predicted oxidoreductase
MNPRAQQKLNKISLTNTNISRMVFGAWRLADVPEDANPKSVARKIAIALELGITTFDHADIYGNYQCEKLFGEALVQHGLNRHKMQLVSKCGIKLLSEQRPAHRIKSYETTRTHIIESVETSLKNLRTDMLDLLLIHRPDPLMDPEDINEAFNLLHAQGKVKAFGVSNFTPSQVAMLQSKLTLPLVSNQIEFSLLNTSAMHNGQLDQCIEMDLVPMAWSPLAGGRLFTAADERSQRVRDCLSSLAHKYDVPHVETIAYAWLLMHPSHVVPVLGTGNETRLKAALSAFQISLERDDWFQLLKASVGHDVP